MRLVALALLVAVAANTAKAVSFFEVVVEEWEGWKLVHGKNKDLYKFNALF